MHSLLRTRNTSPASRSYRPAHPHALQAGLLALGCLPLLTGTAQAADNHELAALLRAETASMVAAARLASIEPIPLTASAFLQSRYTISFRNDPSPFGGDGEFLRTVGFSVPRAQIRLDANIANEQLLAHVMFDFGDAEGDRGRGDAPTDPGGTGSGQLREAWAQYNFGGEQTGYYLKGGQFRSILLYEEAIRPEYQLAVERSVANEFFAPGNTQGVALGFVGQSLAWEVSFNDGIDFLGSGQTVNTPFNSPFEADLAVTARVDYKLAGAWERFDDFASWRGEDVAARVGAGLHWQSQGDTNPGEPNTPDFLFGDILNITNLTWTVDASYESDGWHAFVAYTGHRIEWEFTLQTLEAIQHGVVVQGGIFMLDDIEIFGRYDAVMYETVLVDGFNTRQDVNHFFTVGLNYYLIPQSHAARFTFDVMTSVNPSATLDAGASNSIFLPDPTVTGLIGGTSEEWLMRAQFQLLF
jgi:hypothetical protein